MKMEMITVKMEMKMIILNENESESDLAFFRPFPKNTVFYAVITVVLYRFLVNNQSKYIHIYIYVNMYYYTQLNRITAHSRAGPLNSSPLNSSSTQQHTAQHSCRRRRNPCLRETRAWRLVLR
jgi:hypothetical protein